MNRNAVGSTDLIDVVDVAVAVACCIGARSTIRGKRVVANDVSTEYALGVMGHVLMGNRVTKCGVPVNKDGKPLKTFDLIRYGRNSINDAADRNLLVGIMEVALRELPKDEEIIKEVDFLIDMFGVGHLDHEGILHES